MIVYTNELKSLLQKSMKCSSCNTYIPISNFCRIKEEKDTYTICSTDGLNTLFVDGSLQETIPHTLIDFVVDIKKLYSLVAKTTTDTIKMTIADNVLTVVGNGKYQISLPTDENDEPIKFPKVDTNPKDAKTCMVYADNLKDIVKTNKSSLPKNASLQELDGYVFSDTTITTDSLVICSNTLHLFDKMVMFSSKVVDILCMFDDCIDVMYVDNYYVFKDEHMTFCAYSNENIDSFPIDAINGLLNTGFTNSVELVASDLYAALERLNLFISPYDANACTIDFVPNHMVIHNQNNTCEEVFDIPSSATTTVKVNIEFLMSQLKTMQDRIIFKFGNDKCIGLCDEVTNRIIAVMK